MKIAAACHVELRYRILDDEGAAVESSDTDGPIRYVHGEGEILPGLEAALEGATAGDRRRIELEPADAYGDYDPAGIVSVPRDALPEDVPLAKGEWIEVRVENDEGSEEAEMEMRVVQVHDDEVLLDANHPLAGRRVTFEVQVVSVDPPR